MRLKARPKKPTNPVVRKEIEISEWILQDVVNELPEGMGLNEAFIESRICCSFAEVYLIFAAPKYTEEEFIKELSKYEENLRKYRKWYNENEEEILKALRERETKEEEKKQRQIKSLRKEKERLEKEISKLES